MIVVDNSVLVSALVDGGPTGKACAARLSGERLVAPDLIDLEAANALRGLLIGRKITEREASRAIETLSVLPVERVPHSGLLPRVWELRHNCTPYDAAYVALAEHLNTSLVTGDARLHRAAGARCPIELIR